MKANKIIISAFLISIIIFSQKIFSQTDTTKNEIYKFVENSPSYVGGETARLSFLSSNIIYPAEAVEKLIAGTVYTTFVVEKDGSITDAKIVKDIGGGCGDEVLRVIKLMPKWNPGTNNTKEPVRVQFTMPFKFFRTDKITNEIFMVVDNPPSFVGDEKSRLNFINENLIYPEEAKEKEIEGKVYITFVIEKDGSINDPMIKRDIGGGCGDEALRIVKLMPKWNPGTQRGGIVRVQYTMPITFKL